MTSRRDVMALILRIAGCAAAAASLGLTGSAGLVRAAKKRVLPKGTDPNSLIYSDPKYLDARNLELMPLEEFGTMGDTGSESKMRPPIGCFSPMR